MLLSADGHLAYFHVLAIINSAAMIIGVHMSLSDLVSLVYMSRSGIDGIAEWYPLSKDFSASIKIIICILSFNCWYGSSILSF